MRFRLGTAEDLPAALELLRLSPCFRASDALWTRVMPAWRDWLSSDQMNVVLWEDPRMAPSERLRATGMSVFVSDAFAESTIRSGEPYPARRLYENPDGPDSPVLSQDAIGWANARDGVNLFVLHNPMREHDLQHPSQKELLPLGPQAFYFCHAGYYVKTLLWECYGQQHIDYLVGSGFSLLSSYAPGHPELAEAGPCYRPFLGGLRRPPEIDSTYDPIRLCLFNRCEPLLGLTPPQQKLLRFALLGYTDRELENQLGTSANTLKQRWNRIFETMVRVFPPDALPAEGDPDASIPPGGSPPRLPKRHHVLDYVRQNMHELRPFRR
jgi:hypothetical protein